MTTSWTEASERLSSDSSRCSVLTHSPCRPPLPELNHCCCASKMFAFETRNGRVYKHGSALKERSSSRRQPFVTISSQQTWLKHERCHFTWSGDVSSFHVNSSYYGTRNLVLVSQWRNQTHMRLLISSLSFILCCVSKNNINLSCTQTSFGRMSNTNFQMLLTKWSQQTDTLCLRHWHNFHFRTIHQTRLDVEKRRRLRNVCWLLSSVTHRYFPAVGGCFISVWHIKSLQMWLMWLVLSGPAASPSEVRGHLLSDCRVPYSKTGQGSF